MSPAALAGTRYPAGRKRAGPPGRREWAAINKGDEMMITGIAVICHEANRAYCAAIGETDQKPWADAPEWQRESAINGVRFHMDNPNAGPAGSHENWMREKLAAGWSYGPVKDPENKRHPCLVPYAQLPDEQRAKDRLFVAIVRALA